MIAYTDNSSSAGPSFQAALRKAQAARRVNPVEQCCKTCHYTASDNEREPCCWCDGKKKWKQKRKA